MRINKGKNIGTIIFIVEGSETEFNILNRIFCYIFDFEYVAKKRNSPNYFVGKNQSSNKIYVVNTRDSNISYINDTDYLDNIFEFLINNYELDLDNAAKYYLFDRDPGSNEKEIIEKYIRELNDPYDDKYEYGSGGLLLLSYPSIESYIISNFIEKSYKLEKKFGHETKTYMGLPEHRRRIQFNKLSQNTLIHACTELFEYILEEKLIFDIDNFETLNMTIYEKQEEYFKQYDKYRLVSMVSIMLIQMGLLELEDDDIKRFKIKI